MKKLIAILLLMVFVCPSVLAEEPFKVTGEYSGEIRIVGHLYVDDSTEAIPITFTQEAKNVVISHESGVSLSLKNVFPGDIIYVFSRIPDTMPNLSVSYSIPGDNEEIVYKRMISQSGRDSSYIIMGDWYTEYAWCTAKRMLSLISDETYLSLYFSNVEIIDYINEISVFLPGQMPENSYFISAAPAYALVDEFLAGQDVGILPENMEYFMRGFPEALKSVFVSREGVIATAAASVMRASEYVILPDVPFEPGFIVFDSGEEHVIIVSVSLAGEGIVCFSAGVASRETLKSLSYPEAFLTGLLK